MNLTEYIEKLETLPKEMLWSMAYALDLNVHPCATMRKISMEIAVKIYGPSPD